MAKKKTHDKDADPDVIRELKRLEGNLESIIAKQDSMTKALRAPALSEIISRWKAEIEEDKALLEDCPAKEVIILQQGIKAKKKILRDLGESYDIEIKEAKAALEAFKSQNTLLIQPSVLEDKPEKKSKKDQKPAENVIPLKNGTDNSTE